MLPPEDKEMELVEHLGELRKRVVRISIAFISLISIIFYFSGSLLERFWYNTVGSLNPYLLSPLEWILARLTLSLIVSLIVLYPYIAYELYEFAKPGLYDHERKFIKTLVIPSYIVFILGSFISYKFIIPLLYKFALTYQAEPYLSVGRTLDNAIKLLVAFSLFLQIPLIVFLLENFKIVEYKVLKNFRYLVYIVAFLLLTNISMDFSGFTQILCVAIFVLMYEFGLAIIRVAKNI